MDKIQHKEGHLMLHQYLDELIADWIDSPGRPSISKNTVYDLMRCSSSQTKQPDHDPDCESEELEDGLSAAAKRMERCVEQAKRIYGDRPIGVDSEFAWKQRLEIAFKLFDATGGDTDGRPE